MKVRSAFFLAVLSLTALSLIALAGCASKPASARDAQEIVEELVVDYGNYGEEASPHIGNLLKELTAADPNLGARWEKIANLWASLQTFQTLNYNILPDGLPDSDELCIVALGFQLAPDGTMRDELIERLTVVLHSAEKYPNAYIVCTGGGTASQNPSATEAGEMAKWLVAKGVDPKRVIVEDKSLTTAENAIFTYDILTTQYPKVNQIAIVSSDYHIATGVLLFTAESILRATTPGTEKLAVVSNAAWLAPSGYLSSMFQAGALIELSGDTETAYEIYFETYDIHELPPLN